MVVGDLQQSFPAVTASNKPPIPLQGPPPSDLGWPGPWFDEEYTETSGEDGRGGRPGSPRPTGTAGSITTVEMAQKMTWRLADQTPRPNVEQRPHGRG